jgi:hypothetical protein
VHNGAKLLVGNLSKYRTIEVAELADSGEGTFDFSIEISGRVEMENSWANLLFQGAIGLGDDQNAIRFPGFFETKAENIEIESVGLSSTIFTRAFARIRCTYPNAWIFCASISDGDPLKRNPFQAYDDYWEVGQDQRSLDEFAYKVASLISRQIAVRKIDFDIASLPFAAFKQLGISVRHGPVQYLPREIMINQHTPQNIKQIVQAYLDVPLCKPLSYSNEREYRFMFAPSVGGRDLGVIQEDLFLNPNYLTGPYGL